MNKTELLREMEWRKCRGKGPQDYKAAMYFLETYWHIRHPERGKILLPLREAQRVTLRTWLTERYSIVLKARQIGFSTIAAGMAFWLAFFHSDKFIVLLSRTERESVKLLDKAKYGYKHLPAWMRDRGPKLLQEHQQKMPFGNDSAIESLPSNNDPARGEAVYLVIVDEWAFLPNAEEAWASVEPIADVGGRVIGLSTANGSGNFFHEFWIRATTGTSQFKPIFFPWSAGDRDEAWYETKKRTMLDWQLHQEYPSSPEEAFIRSGNPVFDIDELMQMDTVTPRTGYLHPLSDRSTEFRQNPDGPLQVWDLPQVGVRYVIGADVAEGLDYGDFSVAHVINTLTGRVVAKWRGHIDPDLFGSDVLWYLGHFYGQALIGVEVNNHGLTTCVALTNKSYPNMYYRHSYDERTQVKQRKVGWRTQVNTKPLMIDELARALRTLDPEIELLDAETIGELRTYVRNPDGKMHGSPFDDQVISLAIANQMRKHSFTMVQEHELDDTWTLDWWARQGEEEESGDWLIGAASVR